MHFKLFSSFFQFLPLQVEETYFFWDGLNQGLIRFLPPGAGAIRFICEPSAHILCTKGNPGFATVGTNFILQITHGFCATLDRYDPQTNPADNFW